MLKRYKHIFFDLDRTLWDFDKNSEETLREIYEKYVIKNACKWDFPIFLDLYREINHDLWEEYRQGTISKDFLNVERFRKTMRILKCPDIDDAQEMANYYVTHSPKKTLLFPGTIELLEYLKQKYDLHIITNGFEEIQFRKLKNSDLESFFQHVITSEEAGAKKPDAKIFEYALKKANAQVSESLMIGDDSEVDVLGAKNIGMDSVFVNYFNIDSKTKASWEVKSLDEIRNIL